MQSVEAGREQVKLVFLSMVGSLFDEGIIPGEWVRWNGKEYETVDIGDVMGLVMDRIRGGCGHAG